MSSHFGWVDFAEDHRRKEGVCLSPEIKELWLEAVPPRAGGGCVIGLPQASPPDPQRSRHGFDAAGLNFVPNRVDPYRKKNACFC